MGIIFRSELMIIRPDVVLLHNIAGFSISIYKELARASIPFVQVLHDHYFSCLYSTMYRSSRICTKQCMRCILMRKGHLATTRLASGVIGVSSYILTQIKSMGYFSDVPSLIIKNLSPEPQAAKAALAYHRSTFKDNCVIGFLGTLTESKGIFDLLSAFQQVARPSDRLILAGTINMTAHRLHSLIKDDIRISHVGIVDRDVFFASIDILVVPSRVREAFGLVVQEARFRGVLTVVSNRGALPEIVADTPLSYVYDPDQSNSLAAVLKDVLANNNNWKHGTGISNSDYIKLKSDWDRSYETALLNCVHQM